MFGPNPELSIERYRLRLRRLPEIMGQLRVVQISDLHFGPYTGEIEVRAAVAAANAAHPDLVVLTGDFVTATRFFKWGKRDASGAAPCAELLRGLRSRLGVFAVLGNHDWATNPDFVADALQGAGIRVLRNEAVPIEADGGRVWLAGVDGAFYYRADLDRTLASVPKGEPVILLAHEPDFADVACHRKVDVQLSGHSHAGQICAPFIGALYLPPMGKRYPAGEYRVGDTLLYVNRGLGVHGVPLRLLAPPEVTIFDVQPGALTGLERIPDATVAVASRVPEPEAA